MPDSDARKSKIPPSRRWMLCGGVLCGVLGWRGYLSSSFATTKAMKSMKFTPTTAKVSGGLLIDPPSVVLPSRFWTCRRYIDDTEQKSRKLIFVHVFKAAGTTFRQLFRNYAHVCNRRAVTMRCTSLVSESLANQTSEWRLRATASNVNNYADGPCVPADFVDGESSISERKNITSPEDIEEYNSRQKTRLFEEVSYSKLRRYDVDILSGHMPIGLHSNWLVNDSTSGKKKKNSRKVVSPLYVTFFRDPIQRFVSGVLFHHKHKNWTFEEALAAIKSEINGKHVAKLRPYLMTPAQKEGRSNMTEAETTSLIKSNLVEFPVLIGVIERMMDSLNLIRYAINSDGDALVEQMIDSLDITKKKAAATNATAGGGDQKTRSRRRRLLEKNKSKLSTSALVREIQKDGDVYAKLERALLSEYEIYNYAVKLHRQQVKRLGQKKTFRNNKLETWHHP